MNALEAIRDMNELAVYMMQSANERESLKAEIERLKSIIGEMAECDCEEINVITDAEKAYFEHLKSEHIKDELEYAYWAKVQEGEGFEEWASRLKLNVPDYMSKNQYINANRVQLMAEYAKKKEEGDE